MKSQYLLRRLVPVVSEERFKIGCLFFYTFATTGAYVVGRAAADSLFLSRVGPAQLPTVYLLSAGLIILCSVVYGSLARRFALKPSVLVSLLILGLSSLLGYRLLLVFDQSALLLGGLYLLAELRGGLNTIHYETLTSDLLPHHRWHHKVGLLGASATLAAIVLGGLCAYKVHQLGTAQLLCIAAGLELFAVIPILLLPRIDSNKATAAEPVPSELSPSFEDNSKSQPLPGPGNANQSKLTYVYSIAALMASTVIVSRLIEYQWKVSGAASFAGKEDELAAYFGLFYVVVNVLTGVVQLLFTGRILQLIGTHSSLIVFPATLLAGIAVVPFAWSTHGLFLILTCLKGCDVFKRGINSPALLMLYSPLSQGVRRRAIVWVTGIVKPFSEAASAVVILLLAHCGAEFLFLAVLTFLVCWILFTVRVLPSRTQLLLQPAKLNPIEQNERLFALLSQIDEDYGYGTDANFEGQRDRGAVTINSPAVGELSYRLRSFRKSTDEAAVRAVLSDGRVCNSD